MSIAREPRKRKIIETGLKDLEPSIREHVENLMENIKDVSEKGSTSKIKKKQA